MRFNLLTQCLVLSILIPSVAQASKCTELTIRVNADINKYHDSLETHSLPWLNLTWLKDTLGKAEVNKLGDGETTYKWICARNYNDNLAVIVDENGNLINVSGIYSSSAGAGIFSVNLKKKPEMAAPAAEVIKTTTTVTTAPVVAAGVPTPESVPVNVSAPAAVAIAPDPDMIKIYNKHYKTSFKSLEKLFADNKTRYKTYYKNLRSCTPGTFMYAMVAGKEWVYASSKIVGTDAGACNVETSYTQAPDGKVVLKCHFNNLTIFSDQEAMQAGTGSSSTGNSPTLSPVENAENTQCDSYVNGNKMS
jgi:hypothetical protein